MYAAFYGKPRTKLPIFAMIRTTTKEAEMKKVSGTPKAQIQAQLKARGLSLTRVVNSQGFRVWQTSDGKQYTSWRELQATLAEKDATR
jgi:hypothetical protein